MARRRHGTELEDALLDATWRELLARGYGGLTIDAVAQRAGTSRPVIYRRWATRPELVRAAVVHTMNRRVVRVPDTGNLRDDTVELLRGANERIGMSALLTYHLSGYFQETGTSPADLREVMIAGRPATMTTLLDRAVARGEADPTRLTPRVRTVAFDLFRQEAMLTLAPVPDDVIVSIVDEVFLPLVRPAG